MTKEQEQEYLMLKKIWEDLYFCDNETMIRIGVANADEMAKKETSRRRVVAPLSIEENFVFLKNMRSEKGYKATLKWKKNNPEKAMVDKIIINHVTKTIEPLDFKTPFEASWKVFYIE